MPAHNCIGKCFYALVNEESVICGLAGRFWSVARMSEPRIASLHFSQDPIFTFFISNIRFPRW